MKRLFGLFFISVILTFCVFSVLTACRSSDTTVSEDSTEHISETVSREARENMIRLFVKEIGLKENVADASVDLYFEHVDLPIVSIEHVFVNSNDSIDVKCTAADGKKYTLGFDGFRHYLGFIYCETTDDYIYAVVE